MRSFEKYFFMIFFTGFMLWYQWVNLNQFRSKLTQILRITLKPFCVCGAVQWEFFFLATLNVYLKILLNYVLQALFSDQLQYCDIYPNLFKKKNKQKRSNIFICLFFQAAVTSSHFINLFRAKNKKRLQSCNNCALSSLECLTLSREVPFFPPMGS